MSLIALIAPSAMIAGVGFAHLGYFRHFSRRTQQQAVALDEFSYRGTGGRFRIAEAGPRAMSGGQRTSGTYVGIGAHGNARPAMMGVFDPIADDLSDRVGTRRMIDRDARIASGRFVDTLIFGGDLHIDGDCVFLAPVKIVGDLSISGNAVFAKPLIVNGHVKVAGLAVVRTGILVKGEVGVAGTLIIGEQGREGWAVANGITITGRVFLNGHADSVAAEAPLPLDLAA